MVLKRLINFMKSDVKIGYEYCFYEKKRKIDSFYIISKPPFSRTHHWGSSVGLEYTYTVLKLIQNAIKNKRKWVVLEIKIGLGYQELYIWKGSFKKLEKQLFEMIKEIQTQY